MLSHFLLLATISTGTIQGVVRAEGSLEPIANATVQVAELRRGVLTDAHGYFVLTGLPEGSWRVQARALGYSSTEATVRTGAGGTVRVEFELTRRPVELTPLEVSAERQGPAASPTPLGAGPPSARIDAATMAAVPGIAQTDVFRALNVLPAVASISDWSSALYVRGGAADQNLITLDGVPLFNPYRLGGLFSAVDPGAVAEVEVIPGALPAGVGDRLSSAVQIRTRTGGRDRVRGWGSVGLISGHVGMDGPLPGGAGGFLGTVRHNYLGVATRLAGSSVRYGSTDAYLKLTHDVGALGTVTATGYIDDEGVGAAGDVAEVGGRSGSRAASISYRQPLAPQLIGEVRAAWSRFDGALDEHETLPDGPREETMRLDTRMDNLLVAGELTWHAPRHRVRTGFQVDRVGLAHTVGQWRPEFNPWSVFVPLMEDFVSDEGAHSIAFHAEDEVTISPALSVRAGVRTFHADGYGTSVMPRLGARLALGRHLSLSAGGGRYAQLLRSARDEETLFGSLAAYELMMLMPPGIGLSTSEDAVVGAQWEGGRLRLQADAYLKRFHTLPGRDPDRPPVGALIVADVHTAAEGSARGVEMLGRWSGERVSLWGSYVLAATERVVEGERYPARHDRRHSADLLTALRPWTSGEIALRFAAASGQPYTPTLGVLQPLRFDHAWVGFRRLGYTPVLLGDHNSARTGPYLRLDASARRTFTRTIAAAPVEITPYVQVLNLLNRSNPLMSFAGSGEIPEIRDFPQFPILPTMGVEWRF